MKKKIALLALALILVSVGAVWGVKAAFFPRMTAQSVARDFLIQCYSIPNHEFYEQKLRSTQGPEAAMEGKFKPLLTEDYMRTFLSSRDGDRLEAWADQNGYLVAIDQLNVQPTSTDTKGSTTYLKYDVTLTITRESDKRLATYKESGRINVEKAKNGYRISTWDINNENAFYGTEFFPKQ